MRFPYTKSSRTNNCNTALQFHLLCEGGHKAWCVGINICTFIPNSSEYNTKNLSSTSVDEFKK